jgi:peptide-methionine (S)-S-oxide reductase
MICQPTYFKPHLRLGLLQTLLTAALGSALLCSDASKPMFANDSDSTTPTNLSSATFGGGCFWCLEALYERFKGVHSVVSGYAGGETPNPSYSQVCEGNTGHAEVVQIAFDPQVISYSQLLEIFWEIHDPTTLNRQGADHGTQYRSIILTHNAEQRRLAEASKKESVSKFSEPIVTEIVPLEKFYLAEDSHQDFFAKNPRHPYCVVVISPKLKKLEKDQSLQPLRLPAD